jgi:hypothetical protein
MTKPTNSGCHDTTIAEIHKTRERISDAFDGDIHAITEDARKRQQESGRQTVSYAKTSNEAIHRSGGMGDEPSE